jgi:hypothetical protein
MVGVCWKEQESPRSPLADHFIDNPMKQRARLRVRLDCSTLVTLVPILCRAPNVRHPDLVIGCLHRRQHGDIDSVAGNPLSGSDKLTESVLLRERAPDELGAILRRFRATALGHHGLDVLEEQLLEERLCAVTVVAEDHEVVEVDVCSDIGADFETEEVIGLPTCAELRALLDRRNLHGDLSDWKDASTNQVSEERLQVKRAPR